MLLVQATRFGGPEVLAARQAPDLVAGLGQVVVRASAADVLFIDTALLAPLALLAPQSAPSARGEVLGAPFPRASHLLSLARRPRRGADPGA